MNLIDEIKIYYFHGSVYLICQRYLPIDEKNTKLYNGNSNSPAASFTRKFINWKDHFLSELVHVLLLLEMYCYSPSIL